MRIDDIGWLILGALQRNARASYRELAEEVGLTAPAVAERIRRMERQGLIRGYSVDLDYGSLGLPLLATIRVTARDDASIAAVAALARELPEVIVCHRVTGAESHLIEAAVTSPGHLEELISRLVGVGAATLTNIVTSSPKLGTVITREAAERQGSPASSVPLREASLA